MGWGRVSREQYRVQLLSQEWDTVWVSVTVHEAMGQWGAVYL